MSEKKQIVVFGQALPDDLAASLRESFDVTVVREPKKEKVAFLEALKRAEGMIGASLELGPELLEGAAQLKIISSISVGYDNYDLAYLNRRGIWLTNTPDVLTETTADTGFALILATARRVVELAEYVKQGLWKTGLETSRFGTDVHGKRLGIVGFGRIGQAVARRGHFDLACRSFIGTGVKSPAKQKG